MWSPRSIRVLSFLTLAAVGLTACGSGNSASNAGENTADASGNEVVNREAGSDDTSCPERISDRFNGRIINGLPVPVTLSVPRNSWICWDWSGVSTPGGVLNGKVLQADERHPFRLEQSKNYGANFTLGFKTIGYEGVDQVVIEGETRMMVDVNQDPQFSPGGGVKQEPWLGARSCPFVPIATAPSSWRDTIPYDVFEAFFGISPGAATMFIVYKGRIGLVFVMWNWVKDWDSFCGIPKG
jgi:hypothetical protein